MTAAAAYEEYLQTGLDEIAAEQPCARQSSGGGIDIGLARSWLEQIKLGSAGAVDSVTAFLARIPRVGTSSSVVDRRVSDYSQALAHGSSAKVEMAILAMSPPEQARELLAALALNKSQLASVLRVTRPTLYEWLNGKEPNPSNAQRISSVLQLLHESGVTSTSPLNARYVRQPIDKLGTPLLDVLSSDTLDEEEARRLITAASSLTNQLSRRRESREDRLRDLGYDEHTSDERRETLGRNVAMMDWPKR